eukprot:gnl/MRDRNA2_/MRDRNA2_77673_c0_seq1.p1 gnl/MRDRNA2_/MRDRNA2_77673_c0~~gnl/MRDRNA2_/MRDRNA2_77673_c0_seq1.p1  ORF type:complete len:2496 (-),score=513.38 gnl/MRDRNA2_/MRDRNA2_77673_c0_seq1:248-7735(-)
MAELTTPRSGVRQLGVVLRKNLVLKSRRPCATFLELFLPIILFVGLTWVRGRYDEYLEWMGPYYFESLAIFPLGGMFGLREDTHSRALFEVGGDSFVTSQTALYDKDDEESGSTTAWDDFHRDLACGHMFEVPVENMTKYMMTHKISVGCPWLKRIDWGELIFETDLDKMTKWIHDEHAMMRDWNSTGFVETVDKLRKEYLQSAWASHAEDTAAEVDEALACLADSLDDASKFEEAREKVEEAVRKARDHAWNKTALAKSIVDIVESLRDSPLARWVNGSDSVMRTMCKATRNMGGTEECTAMEKQSTMVETFMKHFHAMDRHHMADWLVNMTEEAKRWDALSMTAEMDLTVWYISHFLKLDSSTVRMLGRSSEEPGVFGSDTTIKLEQGYRTEVASGVMVCDRKMKECLNNTDVRAEFLGMWEDTSKEMEAMKPMMMEMERNGTKAAEKLRLELKSMMDMKPAEMQDWLENKCLTDLENGWRTKCPFYKYVLNNESKIGELLTKTHSSCPFYRQVVRSTQSWDGNATYMVKKVHDFLKDCDSQKMQANITQMQKWVTDFDIHNFTTSMKHMMGNAQLEFQKLYKKMESEMQSKLHWDKLSKDVVQALSDQGVDAAQWNAMKVRNRLEFIRDDIPQDVKEQIVTAQAQALIRTMRTEYIKKNGIYCEEQNKVEQGDPNKVKDKTDSTDSSDSESEDDDDKGSGRDCKRGEKCDDEFEDMTWMEKEIMRRKLLIAPYNGDVKQLIELMIVEFTQGITTRVDRLPGPFKALFRCPLVKGLGSRAAHELLKDRMITFPNEAALQQFAMDQPDDTLAAIVFRSADANGNFPVKEGGGLHVEYAIRMHAQLLPSTAKIVRIGRMAMFGGPQISLYRYYYTWFGFIQETIGRVAGRMRALQEMKRNGRRLTVVGENAGARDRVSPQHDLDVHAEQFPYPREKRDYFIRVIQHTLPMLMILGWIYSVSLLTKEMVYEKQERLREVMRIMGLRTWVYWSSWGIFAMIQMTLLVSLMVWILCSGRVLSHTDPSVLFTFFWLYSLSTVSLASLLSSFFSRAKVAAACAGLAYYGAYLPYALYNRFEDSLGLGAKMAFGLFSSTNLGIGASMMAKWEMLEVGLQWDNLSLPPPVTYSGAAPTDNHSMMHVLIMLVVDAVLYQTAAWYIEKVFPGSYGLAERWYFCFMPSYWFGRAKDIESMDTFDAVENSKALEFYDPPPPGTEAAVQLRKLEKIYNGGKHALKGVDLDVHNNTILGLLGHNGAGKSTAMALLTGLYPPTKGDVLVHGNSIRKHPDRIRQMLGVCLQHNALYEVLTCREHLDLFCKLKGVKRGQISKEITDMLCATGLASKTHNASKTLSGGMKRKLSIGIALVGGSKVVVLDEPTAGVDAGSRRDIWKLLVENKQGRAMLLSTHFMDEADILSDRIAVIAEGRLTCIGGGMALKRHFTEGYTLIVVTNESADRDAITQEVRATISTGRYAGSRGKELCYILPTQERAKFANLFAKFQDEALMSRLGINTFGISAASMEEVFLRASSVHEAGLHGMTRMASEISDDTDSTNEGSTGESSKESAGLKENSETESNPSVPKEDCSFKEEASDKVSDDRPQSPQCMVADDNSNSSQGKLQSPPRTPPGKADQLAVNPVKVKAKALEKHDAQEREVEVPRGGVAKGVRLHAQQFNALLRKRALSLRRDKKAWVSQLVMPAIFVFLALVIAKIREVAEEPPPLKINSDMLIGTNNGGSTMSSMSRHYIPVEMDSNNETLNKVVMSALQAGGGPHDVFEQLDFEALADKGQDSLGKYLMANAKDLMRETYGAVSLYNDNTTQAPGVMLWFKNRAYHALPIMINMWNTARLRLLGYEDTDVQVWSHPLPKTKEVLEEELTGGNQIFTDMTVAITVILAMAFVPASFLVFLVHERATNGKHQQLLSGVHPIMYWMSSYAWDVINYLIPTLLIFALFLSFELAAYTGRNAPAMLLLLLGYGFSMTPLMYCVTTLFKVPSTAYVTMICANIFTGTVSVLTTTVLDFYQNTAPDLKPVNDLLKDLFPIYLPNYCLGRGMMTVAANHYMNYFSEEFGICLQGERAGMAGTCIRDPLEWNVGGRFVMTMFAMVPVWLVLCLLIEWKFFVPTLRMWVTGRFLDQTKVHESNTAGDSDVQNEIKRVQSGACDSEHLVIKNLKKTFTSVSLRSCRGNPFHAVRGINVGIAPGECFGLLGVNGAGKTTTMKMITGDEEVGSGDALVGGFSVRKERDNARQHLGYCPQFDALPEKLTVREALGLYARLKGVKSSEIAQAVEGMIEMMCLEAHQHTKAENLSGGNRRKLSTSIAMIGAPSVVLLDEPSTGIDVGARRFLWTFLGRATERGHALVLTSHSMEECEVLCSRLAIMVAGSFMCLGTPIQLKNQYGNGYTLTIKSQIAADNSEAIELPADKIKKYVQQELPTSVLSEEHVGLIRFRISKSDAQSIQASVKDAFSAMEAAVGGNLKEAVSDYTLSQTSLEEVFLHFSQHS